jgi:protein TonB
MKNILASLAFFLSIVFFSCNSNKDTSNEATTGTDSSMMGTDNTRTHPIPGGDSSAASANMSSIPDTNSTASPDTSTSMKRTEKAKTDPTKKGKKAKVSVTMPKKSTGEMSADKEGYYANVEVLPAYPGGQQALERFFSDNIDYPQQANDNNIEGTVNVNFAVDENGKIYSPKAMGTALGYGIEQEALRVFSKMPNWTPGRIKGKNVKTRFNLPVRFQLSE